MKIISLDQVGTLEPTDYLTPFIGKRGGAFFLAHTVLSLPEAVSELNKFEGLSGLECRAQPLSVATFRHWMLLQLEEELANYLPARMDSPSAGEC